MPPQDSREQPGSQYPPPDNPNQGGYYPTGSPQPPRDERSAYPPPDPARQGQYPPPQHYPPPQQWPGQHHSAYPPPHYPDPQHPGYAYPPPTGGPPQPLQPDAFRLPPPYPPPGYYHPYGHAAAPAPAPRQRTAIACKYCRKRKIRCSGYDASPDGRCQNCVRFNQQCLFHPVSSQAAFVPASAVYGPNTRAPTAGQSDRPGQNGHEAPPPMLYGAHGQPLGPVNPQGQPPYGYPPPPPQGYAPYPYHPHPGPPPPQHANGHQYDGHAQGPPQGGDSVSNRKRPLPDDDPHNEDTHSSQSPHPNSRPRHSAYEPRQNSTGSYEYPDPTNGAPTSPAASIMSYQATPYYQNGAPQNGVPAQKRETSPASGLTPQSAHSFHSPHNGPVRDDGKTPPPPAGQPSSAGSSANGRNGMNVRDMLSGGPPHGQPEQRGRSDNEMLSKLEGKKK